MENQLMKEDANDATLRERSIGGAAGLSNTTKCEARCRLSLLEVVEGQLSHSMREARRTERLQELALLLNKYPDVARILDLVDEVRR